MQNPEFDRGSGETLSRIKIDWTLLVTGTLGIWFETLFWTCVAVTLALVPLGLFFAGTDRGAYAILCGIAAILALPIGLLARWLARGILEGRKLPAILACFAIITLDVFNLRSADGINFAKLPDCLMFLTLVVLLVATFRNRHYWRRFR